MSHVHRIIRRPILTERSVRANEKYNRLTFEVARNATKPQIKEAVRELFGVRVRRVNTMVIPGKTKRAGRVTYRKSGYKKAIVTLAEGETIDFFALGGEPDEIVESEANQDSSMVGAS